MNIIFTVYSLLLATTVLVLLYYTFEESKKISEIEKGKIAIFEEQCGGWFENLRLSIPFVRHTIYEDFLIITYIKKSHIIWFKDIEKIKIKNYFVSKGMVYYINNNKQFTIFSKSTNKVINILKEKHIIIDPM